MRRIILFLMIVCWTTVYAGELKLVWSEEFDYSGLPDSLRWSYEEGFVRNQELQYYTQSRIQNAVVDNGMLVLTAIREKFNNPAYDSLAQDDWRKERKIAEYTSASLTTRGKESWKYGRIEVRAKLPWGHGIWPAIWMLGANRNGAGWPACGEIDIMEYVGHNPNTIYGTVHTAKFNHVKKTQKGSSIEIQKPYEDFHVYAIEWDSRKIDFFVDDQKYFTFNNDGTGEEAWPFGSEQYLILNIAVGGAWGGEQGVDESIFPQKMYIDYVRVYQKQ